MYFSRPVTHLKPKWCCEEGQVATKEGKKAVRIPESRVGLKERLQHTVDVQFVVFLRYLEGF
jgi:hypothetical protein